ncbi:hypothetical protein RS030_4680 [Cryptosporidium xiaoi]|uniref:Uncharacterized protein n=1 Tax=Cryptosporidium xiaoi TaxID=659607 RepID=A0AAV9XVD2_9CRYT
MKNSKVFFTEEETNCYKTWYSIVHNYDESFIGEEVFSNNNDIPKLGVKTALFLRTSGLPNKVLHEIWRLVDSENKGLLSFYNFGKACRLVSFYQNEGVFPDQDLVTKIPKKLAYFNIGLFLGKFNKNTQINLRNIIESYFSDELFVSRTIKAFKQLDVGNKGLVDGSEIFNLFINSNIPREKLREIWDYSDIDNDGKLSTTEFIVFNTLVEVSKRYDININDRISVESIILLLNNVLRSYYNKTRDDKSESLHEWKLHRNNEKAELKHNYDLDIDLHESEVSDLMKIQEIVSSLKQIDCELIKRLEKKKLKLATEHKNLLLEINKIYNKYINNRTLIDHLYEDIKFFKEANCIISNSDIQERREPSLNIVKKSNNGEIREYRALEGPLDSFPKVDCKNWVKFPSNKKNFNS